MRISGIKVFYGKSVAAEHVGFNNKSSEISVYDNGLKNKIGTSFIIGVSPECVSVNLYLPEIGSTEQPILECIPILFKTDGLLSIELTKRKDILHLGILPTIEEQLITKTTTPDEAKQQDIPLSENQHKPADSKGIAGLMPREEAEENYRRIRMQGISDAIVRFAKDGVKIPIEWIEEYNDHALKGNLK